METLRPGFDLLGMAHPNFPFKEIVDEIPNDSPIGWFWSQFGDSRNELQYLLSRGFTILRPQMFWSDAHALVPMEVLEHGLKELREIVQGKDLRLYVSPSCEHSERNASEVRKRIDLVKQIIPSSLPVNNPQAGSGAELKGVLTEHHGGSPGKCDLASTDGTSIYDINAAQWVKEYGNKEHPCFLWGARFNLREVSDPGQNAPPIRDRKAAPDLPYFRSIRRLAEPKGRAVKAKFNAMKLIAPNIYKTHAEDDQERTEGEPDEKRENRPVLIIKSNASSVDILDHEGHTLGSLVRYGGAGSFPGGLSRYYSGLPGAVNLYGFQIGRAAKQKSGNEHVWFRAGRTIYGPVHPAFRAGTFR